MDGKAKTGLSYESLRYERLRSETVEEKTEEQKEGAELFTWHGTVLYRCASEYKHSVTEYKHDSYLMTGLARPV